MELVHMCFCFVFLCCSRAWVNVVLDLVPVILPAAREACLLTALYHARGLTRHHTAGYSH